MIADISITIPVQDADGKTIMRSYKAHINAYWVWVSYEGMIVYQRTADNGPWMDKSHMAITDALRDLERALEAVV